MSFVSKTKPAMWALSPGLVAPEWGWFHEAAIESWPIWGGSLISDAGADAYFERQLGTKLHRWHSPNGSSDSARIIGQFGAALRVGDGTGSNDHRDRWVISENLTDFTPGSEGTVAILYTITDHASSRDFIISLTADDGGLAQNESWFLGSNTSPSPFSQRFVVAQDTNVFTATGNNLVVGDVNFEVGTWRIGGRVKLYQGGVETGDAAAPTSGSLNTEVTWNIKLGDINGGENNAPQFNCHMVAILDRQISASQVAQWFRNPFGPFRMFDEARVVYDLVVAAVGLPDLVVAPYIPA